jgi:GNAT superfamily N-acetyltransferase
MLTIRRVDPEHDETMTAYSSICIESESFEDPYATPFTYVESREALRNTDPSDVCEGYLGYVDDRPVATGTVFLFLSDNTDKSFVFVNTLPEFRNRGHGSQMLDFALERLRTEGRTTALSEATYPFEADESHPYRRFLTDRGFEFSQAEVHRVLELPPDAELLDKLEADAAPHHADYTLADYTGLVPESMREDYCVLLNQIIVDAPSGTIDFEEGRLTPEMLAEKEESSRARGRTTYVTVALDRDGVPVAHNVLVVPETDPGKIFNHDTLVRRDHRGHRLGLATKIHNLRRVAALHPDRTTVHTWNAESNAPMIAVNDAMGFTPVRYGGAYHRPL